MYVQLHALIREAVVFLLFRCQASLDKWRSILECDRDRTQFNACSGSVIWMTKNTQENHSSASPPKGWLSKLPARVWTPIAASFLILVVGLVGLAARQPWLFPSLGSTAFLLVENPQLPSARFYNLIVGHLVGLGAGFLAVTLLGAGDAPAVLSTNELTPIRVWASVLAVVLNMLGVLLLKASHPPSAATTLLVALGCGGIYLIHIHFHSMKYCFPLVLHT